MYLKYSSKYPNFKKWAGGGGRGGWNTLSFFQTVAKCLVLQGNENVLEFSSVCLVVFYRVF